MFAIATSNADVIQDAVRKEYRIDNFKPFDIVPLADKPLVRLAGRIFCVSVPLLMSKLSDGLYYLIANSLVGKDRDRFTRFLGVVFEQYLVQLLTRMLKTRNATILNGKTLQEAAVKLGRSGIKTADCFILVDRIAVLVESKARFFARAARSGEDWDSISARIKDVYSRGSRQLESTIELAEAGGLAHLGVRPEGVETYVPLVVSLDETPMTPPVYDLIAPAIPAKGADKTVALQVVGISELEPLEVAVARGALNLHVLLRHKANSGRQATSLRNVIFYEPGLRGLSEHNPLLRRVYDEEMASALRVLKMRER